MPCPERRTCINSAALRVSMDWVDAPEWRVSKVRSVRMTPQFDLVLIGVPPAVQMLIVHRPLQCTAGQTRQMQHGLPGLDRKIGSELGRTRPGFNPQS